MIRVRDNNTKRFESMHRHPSPIPHKRKLRRNTKLKPTEKLGAVQRILNGQTKASVSRDMNVPESTLRGWCKTHDKIQLAVYRELVAKTISKNESSFPTVGDNFKTLSQQQLEKPQNSVPLKTRQTSVESNASSSNSSTPYRPWSTDVEDMSNTNTKTANNRGSNQFGFNIQHYPRPYCSPPQAAHSHSPISMTSQVISPVTEEEKMSRQSTQQSQSVVKRLEVHPAAPSTRHVPLDLRLTSNSNIHRPNPMSGPARDSDNKSITSNDMNESNNNNTAEDCDNQIDPFDAFRYAQRFYNWFQTYSDPTLTAQDFSKFEDLLGRVGEITQRLKNSSRSDAKVHRK